MSYSSFKRVLSLGCFILGLVSLSAQAAEMTITINIPQMDTAEYHRPYVAVWIEDPGQTIVANLAVWYDMNMKDQRGTEWLKDLRQWWRRGGRELEMPIDGVSGATRPVGSHTLKFDLDSTPLNQLTPGEYHLFVEAVREVGGRELIKIPFNWPVVSSSTLQLKSQGQVELGQIEILITP